MNKVKISRIGLLFAATFALLFAGCKGSDYVSYTDTISVNGVELFYAAEGAGKPVILLHGNGGSHNDMETTTRQLAQAGYLVYAPFSKTWTTTGTGWWTSWSSKRA